ncbi:hypothetical protein ACFY2K_26105 [Kitasatospora sp. NPDC001309]|uniref:hypothetical protein n=1 Tax=Kitasatospora sp. NPDC001309 TaxID=3364013 RepID=UPI003690631B
MDIKRPTHADPVIDATLAAIYDDETGKKIRTYEEAALFLGVKKGTIAARLHRANVGVRGGADYGKYLPANLKKEHADEKENVRLRALAEEEYGVELTAPRAAALDAFKRKSEKLICCYDEDYGYYWRARKAGETGWIEQD